MNDDKPSILLNNLKLTRVAPATLPVLILVDPCTNIVPKLVLPPRPLLSGDTLYFLPPVDCKDKSTTNSLENCTARTHLSPASSRALNARTGYVLPPCSICRTESTVLGDGPCPPCSTECVRNPHSSLSGCAPQPRPPGSLSEVVPTRRSLERRSTPAGSRRRRSSQSTPCYESWRPRRPSPC